MPIPQMPETIQRTLRRRNFLRAGLAIGVSIITPATHACEYFAANLRITHPWTRATADGASAAVLCMRFDDVTQSDRLIGVATPVAAHAQMGGAGSRPDVDFFIPEGQESVLSESTTHVLLVGLRQPLELGRSYPLRLVFDKGGVVDAMLNVDYTSFRFK